jgi:hypothetical protein
MGNPSTSQALNTGQQLIQNYDLGKIFIGRNRYDSASYINNSGYSTLNLLQGTVMGRVTATRVLKPATATSTDGSQIPIGILAHDVSVLSGETKSVTICVEGDVAEEKVIFLYGDTLDTVVGGRIYRDQIAANTVGINLVPCTDPTGYDNQ